MKQYLARAFVAAALVAGAAGGTLLLPNLVAAASPSASPAASPTTTTSGSGSTPSTSGSSTTTVADCANGGPHGPGGIDSDDLTAAAQALGMTEADLTTALDGGQTLADVASTQKVNIQKVIDAIVAADTSEIQADVSAGTITQAQADQRLSNLTAHVTDEVNGVAPVGGPGGFGGPGYHGQAN